MPSLQTPVSGSFITARPILNTASPHLSCLCHTSRVNKWPNANGLNLKAVSIARTSCCMIARSGPSSTCLAVLLSLAYLLTTRMCTSKVLWLILATLASQATSINKLNKVMLALHLPNAHDSIRLPMSLHRPLL